MNNAKQRYKYRYLFTVVMGLISAVFMSRFSVSLGKVIDVVITPKDTLINTVLLCGAMLLCWLLASFIYDYSAIAYVNRIIRYMKERLYKTLFEREMNEFHHNEIGTYLSLYSKDIDLLTDNYLIPRCNIVCNFLSAAVCLLSIFLLNWKLGIAFVIISILTIVASQLPGVIMSKKTEEYTAANKSYMALLENYLSGFEQIKLLCVGKLFKEKLNQKDKEYENSRKNYLFAKIVAGDLGMSFGMFSQLLCMSVGIYFVLNGGMTVGVLIAAVQLLNGVFGPLQNFVSDKNLMGTASEIIERIDVNSETKELQESDIAEKVETIEFHEINLSFGEKEIFHDYNLKLEKGKKYAIVGESGKGKSTLMKLMLKYIPNSDYSGSITINGDDIQEYTSHSLYGKIGYVQKNEFLVNGTVEDNICLYRDQVSRESLDEIYKTLNFNEEFVNKNVSSANAKAVSYGEKQRIDIARFLVNDYDVLVFDEPTSNLDENRRGNFQSDYEYQGQNCHYNHT